MYFNYKGNDYLEIQKEGFAAQYCFPFAKKLCIGDGIDVGCNRLEWAFPGAKVVDLEFEDGYHATRLPKNPNVSDGKWDYIFSSHCVEHLNDWVRVLDYWWENIRPLGGVLFLYLPDYSQKYWRPWANRKHVNILTPQYLKDYFEHKGCNKVFVSGVDLYNAFTVVAIK